MSQRIKMVGGRSMIIWLLIVIALIVIVLLSVVGLVVWPEMQIRRAEQAQMVELERHYQAGVAFQEVNDWDAAAGEYRQVITGDANYKDAKDRLGVVKARLAEIQATATAVAIAKDINASATAVALATAQADATTTAKILAATATSEAMEALYESGLGFINLGEWIRAKEALQKVFTMNPNYKDVQPSLRRVNDELARMGTPSPIVTATETAINPKDVPDRQLTSFSALTDPTKLNPKLGWQPGGSAASDYDLKQNPAILTLVAGPSTDQWGKKNSAPLVIYPIEGDFVAQVKVNVDPIQDYQHAGIGIRSASSQYRWLRISRASDTNSEGQSIYVTGDRDGKGLRLSFVPFVENTVWLKIARRGSLFDFYYSTNGENWTTLEQNFVFDLPSKAEIFLVVFSTPDDKGMVAHFSEFEVSGR